MKPPVFLEGVIIMWGVPQGEQKTYESNEFAVTSYGSDCQGLMKRADRGIKG